MSNRSNDWRETPYSFNHRRASENVRHKRYGYTDPEGYSDRDQRSSSYSRRDQQLPNDEWRPYENQQQANDAYGERGNQYRQNNDAQANYREQYDPYRGHSRFEPGNNWNESQDNYSGSYQAQRSNSAYDNTASEQYQPESYRQNTPASHGHPHDNSYRNERFNMNWQQGNQQNFRGYGPKNYKRSDARISEDINDRLYDDPYLDASEIEINVKSGEVIIEGTVDSRQSKRFLEDIADSVSGVTHVENRTRVNSRFWEDRNSATQASSNSNSKTKKSSTNREQQ